MHGRRIWRLVESSELNRETAGTLLPLKLLAGARRQRCAVTAHPTLVTGPA